MNIEIPKPTQYINAERRGGGANGRKEGPLSENPSKQILTIACNSIERCIHVAENIGNSLNA